MIYDIYFWWKGWKKFHGSFADSYTKDHKWFVYPPTLSRCFWIITNWEEPSYNFLYFKEVRKFLKLKGS